jgi:hypothetical protein
VHMLNNPLRRILMFPSQAADDMSGLIRSIVCGNKFPGNFSSDRILVLLGCARGTISASV